MTTEIRHTLFQHIRDNAKSKGIYLDCINGYTDHVHCLVALNAEMTIPKMVQLLKGEAAYWANKQNLLPSKLEWADEYFAVSVSESIVEKVRVYINNQEEHHKKQTFTQEYDAFLKTYQFTGQG